MGENVLEKIDLVESQKLLNTVISKVRSILRNPGDVDKILKQLEEKMKTVPVAGSVLSDVPVMIAMVKAWVTKEYTVVSPKVIACLVGAILYLLKKKDLIPDYIPIVGIADDLAVMGLALKLSEPELKAFAEWRANPGAQQGPLSAGIRANTPEAAYRTNDSCCFTSLSFDIYIIAS